MPQSSTRKDAISLQRAQDKESKRARGALSCAECRRLKLKCDKTVPCSSCKRRGCSAICPNGSLITGQGTRFVLADTEKLHQKIAQMSDRIRQLEDALAILQSTQSRDPHPLLHRDLLKIKSSIELHSAAEGEDGSPAQEEDTEESQYIDAFGTLAIRDDGAATFYGRSAGSESLLIGEASSTTPEKPSFDWDTSGPQPLPSSISQLSAAFPIASTIHATSLDSLLHSYLPSWSDAWRLCNLYLEQAPWFFGAVTKRQLYEELLPVFYTEAPAPDSPPFLSNTTSTSTSIPPSADPPAPRGTAHELALLFVILCFGALTDMTLPSAPDNAEADQYHQLTKAALALDPVLERPPSVTTVQAIALLAIYEGLCSGENSIESTWALMGLATKLAQSIGLHRDCARWKLKPAEVQKRRALFWELFITDCWQSLATGRLATFSLPFVDCELPFDPDQTMDNDGSIHPSFPYWKARFGAECVSAVVQGTLTSRAPRYSIILELDRKVRDMELPVYAHGPPPQGVGLAQTMSHFMPTNYRELTLLYIHRCFFAHAISSHPLDPIKSQYAPSFLAGYRSACTIIDSLKQQFNCFPAQIARFWVLWTHAFSSAVMLASVVTHASQSKVAPAALLELKVAYELFESAAAYGGRAIKFLPIIQRLQAKAQQVYLETNSGIVPRIPNDIFRSTPPEGEHNDELSIFSGQTHTVATKTSKSSTPPTRPRPGASPHIQLSGSSSASTSSPRSLPDSPQGLLTDNPSFAGVHPSLVNELNVFDGHIAAQIRVAYHVNNGLFAAPMENSRERRQQDQQRERQRQRQRGREREGAVRQQEQQWHQMEAKRHQQMELQQREMERLERQQLVMQEMDTRQQQMQEQRRLQQPQIQQAQHNRQQEVQHYEHQQPFKHQQDQHQHRPYQHAPLQNHPHSQYQQDYEQQPPTFGSAAHAPRPILSHSQSFSILRQEQHHHHHIPPQHQPSQVQHSMYVVPPEYRQQHQNLELSAHPPQPVTFSSSEQRHSYSTHANPQHMMVDTDDSNHDGGYWMAAPMGLVYSNTSQGPADHLSKHHYTPGGALKGIAADDRSLQETWQSYMCNVGSPRHFLED